MPLDAVAIYLDETKEKITCRIVNLKNGKFHENFFYNLVTNSLMEAEYWLNFFHFLTTKYSPNITEAIVFNLYAKHGVNSQRIQLIVEIGEEFGYRYIHFLSHLSCFLTQQLMFVKTKGQKFQFGDYVLIGQFFLTSHLIAQVHLLKKQEIGWDVIGGKAGFLKNLGVTSAKEFINNFLNEMEIILDEIKCFVVRLRPVLQNIGKYDAVINSVLPLDKLFLVDVSRRLEYSDMAGEYLAKVHSGEKYFTDYDWFVGIVCEEKFELVCGNMSIVLPIQFKRLPFTLKKKIRLLKCKKIQLCLSCDHIGEYLLSYPQKTVIDDIQINMDQVIVLITLSMDENKMTRFKIEEENDEIISTSKFYHDEFKGDRPRIVFGKDYCFVNIYKNGLLWRVRDINENQKIPFYLSFDKEIYVGDAALEHSKYLMPKVDFETLFNKFIPNTIDVMENQLLSNENSGQFMVIKTFDGWKKTTPDMIVAIFIKSILKIIEQELQISIENVHFETLFRCVQTKEVLNPLISNVCQILRFKHVSYNISYLE